MVTVLIKKLARDKTDEVLDDYRDGTFPINSVNGLGNANARIIEKKAEHLFLGDKKKKD